MEPYQYFALFMSKTIPNAFGPDGVPLAQMEFVSWMYTQRTAAENVQALIMASPSSHLGRGPVGIVTEQDGTPLGLRMAA